MFGFMRGERVEKLSSSEIERRCRLLLNIIKIHLSLIVGFGSLVILFFIFVINTNPLIIIVPISIAGIGAGLSWLWLRQKNLKVAAYLEIFATILLTMYMNLLIKADGTFNLCYIWALVLAALFLDGISTLICGVVIILLTILAILMQQITKTWPPLVELNPDVLANIQLAVAVSILIFIVITLIVM